MRPVAETADVDRTAQLCFLWFPQRGAVAHDNSLPLNALKQKPKTSLQATAIIVRRRCGVSVIYQANSASYPQRNDQSAATLCGWGVKAGVARFIGGCTCGW